MQSRAGLALTVSLLLASSAMASFPSCMNETQAAYRNLFSGVLPNQLGLYDSCVSKDGMKFVLVEYINRFKNKFEIVWGQCVGSNCTEEEVAAYYQEHVPISKELYFVAARNPDDPKNRHEFGKGAWAFVVFIASLLIFVVIATIISQSRKIDERNKKLMTTRSTIRNVQDLQVPGMVSVLTMNPAVTVVDREPSVLHQGEKPKEKKEKPFLALFDAVHNMNSLIYPRIVNPSVQVFDLLRVMAMVWVVLGHELAYRMSISQNFVDPGFLDYSKNSWYFTYNQSGFYAVDIFLFMGGYVSIVSMGKFIDTFAPFKLHKIPLVYIFCVFKRYMRIMPAYAVLIWAYYVIAPTVIDGPCSQAILYRWPCTQKNFWESFALGLHVDTTKSLLCAGWGWYLALDFRVFATIPAILIISTYFGKKKKQAGMAMCLAACLVSIGYTYIQGYKHDVYYLNPKDEHDTMNNYYYADTIQRSVIYYIGCLFAYMTMKPDKKKEKVADGDADKAGKKTEDELKEDLLHQEKKKKHKKRKATKRMQFIFFLIGFVALASVTLVLHYVFQWGRDVMSLNRFWTMSFLAFGKVAFIIGLMTVLLVISFTFRGFGEHLAGNRMVQLIANLSFSMYLFHFPVIYIRIYSLRSIPTYQGYDLFSAGLADISYTLVLAVVASLTVEIPAMHIWRVWLEGPILYVLKKL